MKTFYTFGLMKVIEDLKVLTHRQSEIAKELGIHPTYINQIIQGKKIPGRRLEQDLIEWVDKQKSKL